MPYEGNSPATEPLSRIAEASASAQLLRRARTLQPTSPPLAIVTVRRTGGRWNAPGFRRGDRRQLRRGGRQERLPRRKVGYCTVASVLVNLREIEQARRGRPVDPRAFRKTEEAATVDAALPGATSSPATIPRPATRSAKRSSTCSTTRSSTRRTVRGCWTPTRHFSR